MNYWGLIVAWAGLEGDEKKALVFELGLGGSLLILPSTTLSILSPYFTL